MGLINNKSQFSPEYLCTVTWMARAFSKSTRQQWSYSANRIPLTPNKIGTWPPRTFTGLKGIICIFSCLIFKICHHDSYFENHQSYTDIHEACANLTWIVTPRLRYFYYICRGRNSTGLYLPQRFPLTAHDLFLNLFKSETIFMTEKLSCDHPSMVIPFWACRPIQTWVPAIRPMSHALLFTLPW